MRTDVRPGIRRVPGRISRGTLDRRHARTAANGPAAYVAARTPPTGSSGDKSDWTARSRTRVSAVARQTRVPWSPTNRAMRHCPLCGRHPLRLAPDHFCQRPAMNLRRTVIDAKRSDLPEHLLDDGVA